MNPTWLLARFVVFLSQSIVISIPIFLSLSPYFLIITNKKYLGKEFRKDFEGPLLANFEGSRRVPYVCSMHQGLHYVWPLLAWRIEVLFKWHRFYFPHELKVLCHICVQNVLNDLLPEGIIITSLEVFQDVAKVIFNKKEESSCMMVLKYGLIIVKYR